MSVEPSHNAVVPRVVPRVVIDARMIGPVPHGIARYVCAIALGLQIQKRKLGGLPYEPVFLMGPHYCQEHPELKKDTLASFCVYPMKSRFLSLKELIELPKALKNLKAALYHSPSFSSLWNCPCPSAVTIHDLNHLRYGSLGKKLYYQILLRRFSKRSKKIITVSEFSKAEIANWLKLPKGAIEVVYNAIEPPKEIDVQEDAASVLDSFGLKPKQYFFCLSNSKTHKNLSTLVKAYEIFRKQQAQAWPLVLTVDRHGPYAGVKCLGGLPSSTVETLLTHASALFFPSSYEGFGLPPVEAAVRGVPLVISKIPPHQEGLVDLSGHEVLWIEPSDLHGWVNAFHRIFRSEVSPPSLSHQHQILERFSVEKIGQNMDRIYRQALGIQ